MVIKRKALPRKKRRGERGPGKKGLPTPPAADMATLVGRLPGLPPGRKPSSDWVREQAKYLYTMSMDKVSMADIANHPLFKGRVSVHSLHAWCTQESWVDIRRQVAEAWRVAITEQTGRELIEARRQWLRNLSLLGGYIFKHLIPNKKGEFKVEAQSYESMAQAFVKVVSLMDTMTQNSLDDILPEVPGQAAVEATGKTETALRPDLSPEEARIGARAILEARLARQQQLAASPDSGETGQ
jgi:hypothetical protein